VVQLEDLEGGKRLIPNFQTWTQCFVIYAAALLKHHPDKLPLMAYMFEMAKNARKFKWPSRVVYDQNFQMQKASKAGMTWSTVDLSIYTQCFLGMAVNPSESSYRTCQSLDHSSSSCLAAPHPPKRRRTMESQRDLCCNFNTKGCTYTGCCYIHKYWHCKGTCLASGCTVKSEPARDRSN